MKRPNTLWVFPGGESKGMIQAGQMKALSDHGIRPQPGDIITGISIGAFNGAMAAMGKEGIDTAAKVWKQLHNKDVYKGKLNIWSAIKMLISGSDGMVSGKPALNLAKKYIKPERFVCPFYPGVVNVNRWRIEYPPTELSIHEAIYASGTMPLVWPSVKGKSAQKYIDGGPIDNCPLGFGLKFSPKNVIILGTQDRKIKPVPPKNLKNSIDLAKRVLEGILHNTLINDIEQFEQINHNVRESGNAGITLTHRKTGRELKYFDSVFIEPRNNLGSFMDFEDKENYAYGYQLGCDHIDQIKKMLDRLCNK